MTPSRSTTARGKKEAERLDIPFLGDIPLDGRVRAGGDAGEPIVIGEPDGPVTRAFLALATKLTEARPLDGDNARKGVFSFMKS